MCKLILYIVIFIVPILAFAQAENKLINEGNKDYDKENYNAAQNKYNEALSKNPNSERAKFNKANTLYKEGKYKEAADIYKNLSESSQEKEIKTEAYYNLGNSLLKSNDAKGAISAYKNSLKLYPSDPDVKYNLETAIRMQKEKDQNNKNNEKNKGDNNKNDKNDKKDKDKQKDKDKNGDKKDKEKPQANQNHEKKDNGQNPNNIDGKEQKKDKASALNSLKAVEELEKKTMKRRLKDNPSKSSSGEKPW